MKKLRLVSEFQLWHTKTPKEVFGITHSGMFQMQFRLIFSTCFLCLATDFMRRYPAENSTPIQEKYLLLIAKKGRCNIHWRRVETFTMWNFAYSLVWCPYESSKNARVVIIKNSQIAAISTKLWKFYDFEKFSVRKLENFEKWLLLF